MSSITKTKCPKCGAITTYHLGKSGFYGIETTSCACGYKYQNAGNCVEITPDRDDSSEHSLQSRLACFTTLELEEELKRRKG